MSQLSKQACEACRADAQRLNQDRQKTLLTELDGWQIADENGVSQLIKVYDFTDFVSAIAFSKKVGELAEAFGHHPAILTEWGRVTVRWWTHKINGLHKNDFIMAAKTDEIV